MSRWIVLLLAAIALLALVLSSWGDAATAARAWVCAFVFVSMIPIGSLALLLINGISGGRWGEDFAPVLVPSARAMPLLVIAFVPVIIFRPLIYQWSELGLPHDVLGFYLNPLFFDFRTLFGLAVWSVLALCGAWRNQVFAALGLTAHGLLLTFLPADWALTIQPGSVSAGFGLGLGIEQMFAALALTAVLAPQAAGRANRDLAGIMVTTLLGAVYFLYMQFLITWYGNIPAKVHWYVIRDSGGWEVAGFAAFLIGAALPFLAILNPHVRREPSLLRIVGCLVLAGIALHISWTMIPAFGGGTILPSVFAVLLMALILWFISTFRDAGFVHER